MGFFKLRKFSYKSISSPERSGVYIVVVVKSSRFFATFRLICSTKNQDKLLLVFRGIQQNSYLVQWKRNFGTNTAEWVSTRNHSTTLKLLYLLFQVNWNAYDSSLLPPRWCTYVSGVSLVHCPISKKVMTFPSFPLQLSRFQWL